MFKWFLSKLSKCNHKWYWYRPKYIKCDKCKIIVFNELKALDMVVREVDNDLINKEITREEYSKIIEKIMKEF